MHPGTTSSHVDATAAVADPYFATIMSMRKTGLYRQTIVTRRHKTCHAAIHDMLSAVW